MESFSGSPRECSVMITFICYYCFYFTYFKIHGSEETHRICTVHGAEAWGEGCGVTRTQGGLAECCRVPAHSHISSCLLNRGSFGQAQMRREEPGVRVPLGQDASVHEFLHVSTHLFFHPSLLMSALRAGTRLPYAARYGKRQNR